MTAPTRGSVRRIRTRSPADRRTSDAPPDDVDAPFAHQTGRLLFSGAAMKSEKLHTRLDREAIERGLWDRPRAEVRDELILHFLPFAEALAEIKCQLNSQIEFDDARQEAMIGLINAVDSFDPNNALKASFTTFAGWRVRGAAEEASRKNDWCSHKQRAADRELRARFEAGDESVRVCDLLPGMNSVSFQFSSEEEDGPSYQPESRPEVSSSEAATMLLEKMVSAVDPVTARYVRDILEAGYAVAAAGKRHISTGTGETITIDAVALNDLLANKWGTTVEGAATIRATCLSTLQSLQLPA